MRRASQPGRVPLVVPGSCGLGRWSFGVRLPIASLQADSPRLRFRLPLRLGCPFFSMPAEGALVTPNLLPAPAGSDESDRCDPPQTKIAKLRRVRRPWPGHLHHLLASSLKRYLSPGRAERYRSTASSRSLQGPGAAASGRESHRCRAHSLWPPETDRPEPASGEPYRIRSHASRLRSGPTGRSSKPLW